MTIEKITNVSRYIQADASRMLWAVSAGICEFRGCTNRLFTHHVTNENVNLAEQAHIYAFSEGGKRYSRLLPRSKINDIDNLMLVCDSCHKLIDSSNTNYSAEELLNMKKEHEERISILTSIKPCLKSEVVIYNCNIGNSNIRIKDFDANESIIPEYYPARKDPINLSPDLKLYDNEIDFWNTMARDLERRFALHEPHIINKHISLFAVAPQPLLFKLGTLLNRNYDVSVRQPQENIASWRWSSEIQTIDLRILEYPQTKSKENAVITIEITAQMSDAEVKSVFRDFPAYRIIANNCNPKAIKSQADLLAVVNMYREVLNKIRLECVPKVRIALLPIAPVSVSIEAGRQLMKGDPEVVVYDRNYITKKWMPAISFKGSVK